MILPYRVYLSLEVQMKKILAGLLLLSAAFAFAGGNKDSAAEESGVTTLSFINWGSAEEATMAAFNAMIADFEQKNPDIKIDNWVVPYNQMFDQLLILNAGGEPPDVAQLHGTWVSALQNAGALAPLDSLLPQNVQDDFYPQVKEGLIYNGQLYAAPWSPSPVVLYYNKTLLNKAGYTEPPKTMEELFVMAEAVANLGADESGNTIYGVGIQSKKLNSSGFYFLPFIWDKGGDLTDETGNVVINSDATKQALAEVKELFDKNISPVGLEIKDLRTLFAQGLLGFTFDGDFGYATFLALSPKGQAFADEIGIAVMPGEPGNMNGFFIEHNLGIFEKSEKKEAAARFVAYLSSPEAMAIYNANNGNKTPARYSVEQIPFYSAPENAHMRQFITAMQNSRPLPQKNPGFVAAMEEIAEGIQRVGINNESPDTVVPEMAEKIIRIYSEQ